MDDHRLARILGWVTIGAGLSLCASPGPLMNAFGMGERPNLGRFLGAREGYVADASEPLRTVSEGNFSEVQMAI